MRFRVCGALLFMLSACATSTPQSKEREQLAPASSLVVPKTATVPAPIGLNPPAPLMVVPEGEPTPSPKSSPDKGKDPAPATISERRPECTPQPVPHRGGDVLHDKCADKVPQNGFPGSDVLVNGKRFDALQFAAFALWEVKTDNFDTYPADLREIVIGKQVTELQRERGLAKACGFAFRVGVRSAAHKAALEAMELTLDIVVMDWC